jgi:hypothetical protein
MSKIREKFDRFHGLKASNNSGEHAQDTCFASCWDCSLGWRLWQETTVAGAAEMGCEDCDLSFKLEDGAMYERFLEEKRRVIGGEASWEVVGAIENSVVRPE